MPTLFALETERFRLSWSGPAAGSEGGVVSAHALRRGADLRLRVQGQDVPGARGTLALTEQTAYTVLLQSRTGAPVALATRDPVSLGGLARSEDGRIVHGPVDFGDQVGTAAFTVRAGGVPEVTFCVEVLPAKLTPGEVATLRQEVEAVLADLALTYLAPTTTRTSRPGGRPERLAWLTLLRDALPPLERALETIARRPRAEIVRAETPLRVGAVQRPDSGVRRALRRAPTGPTERMHFVDKEVSVPAVLALRPPALSLDTPAHRWLRARLDVARRRLAAIRREEAERTTPFASSPRQPVIQHELGAMGRRLSSLLGVPPLAEASPDRPPLVAPLLLRLAPAYTDAYEALRLLDLGLALAEGALAAAPRGLAALYETWAYVAVVRAVAQQTGQPVPAARFFAVTARGVRVTLRAGHAHAVRFALDGGGHVEVAYNPRFPAPPGLLAQRPDLLITIHQPGRATRALVLDAKYRRDDSAAYRRRHGAPGPPEDALGDLHRYRDALLVPGPGGVERFVEAAVALFPYREAPAGTFPSESPSGRFGESRLWASLSEIGVGAIPLLPGETGYLDRWLGATLGP